MKLIKTIEISIQEMLDIYFSMRQDQQQEFLNKVHFNVIEPVRPKKLTAKQIKTQELELFMEDLRRDRRKAANKLMDRI